MTNPETYRPQSKETRHSDLKFEERRIVAYMGQLLPNQPPITIGNETAQVFAVGLAGGGVRTVVRHRRNVVSYAIGRVPTTSRIDSYSAVQDLGTPVMYCLDVPAQQEDAVIEQAAADPDGNIHAAITIHRLSRALDVARGLSGSIGVRVATGEQRRRTLHLVRTLVELGPALSEQPPAPGETQPGVAAGAASVMMEV